MSSRDLNENKSNNSKYYNNNNMKINTQIELRTADAQIAHNASNSDFSNNKKHNTCHMNCCIRSSRYFRSAMTSAKLVRRVYAILLFLTLCSSVYSCGPGRGIGGSRRNRKLTPLVFKQHVPNMSEKTLGASGLSQGAISRDSANFKNLVPNYNDIIIFKDEEGSGADHFMSRRCKEKLNSLAVSVMHQWPGVRLRVTESWDEDNLHGVDSLHYEGRAVDITTSDRDRTKYGMLARLAVEAGFDWVYYESRAHIHCSVKSDSSQAMHMNGCFTKDSTVLTSSGEHKSMADLRIGELVLSMDDRGEPVYSEVILFMDHNLKQKQEFVQMITSGGAVLTVTPAHLVMVWRSLQQTADYVFAAQVEEGDFVFVHEPDKHKSVLRPQRVIKLKAVLKEGVVAPLTRQGTIVVDAVAASCYAILESQKLAHWSMAPMRWLTTLEAWWAPQHNELTSLTAARQQVQQGVHWYAKTLTALKDYMVPKSWQYQQ